MTGAKAPTPTAPDPTEHSRWRLLQAAMDADIARIYAEAQIGGLKPSFVMELLRLHGRGPMTISELAESVQLTHSATSRKWPRCAPPVGSAPTLVPMPAVRR